MKTGNSSIEVTVTNDANSSMLTDNFNSYHDELGRFAAAPSSGYQKKVSGFTSKEHKGAAVWHEAQAEKLEDKHGETTHQSAAHRVHATFHQQQAKLVGKK